uniref:Peroxisomal targeting signal type 1 Pts1 receptor n=1 Tax=Rhizophora mucronata TaxID=61149 RepID=A0A2P2L0W5_RHIMU
MISLHSFIPSNSSILMLLGMAFYHCKIRNLPSLLLHFCLDHSL